MTDEERIAVVRRALRAAATGDAESVRDDFTENVQGSTPGGDVTSRDEVLAVLADRDDAFSDVELELANTAVTGNSVFAEWVVTGRHTGALDLEGVTVAPSGNTVEIRGAGVAEFEGSQIAAFRQYWNELSLIEQLGVLDDD